MTINNESIEMKKKRNCRLLKDKMLLSATIDVSETMKKTLEQLLWG
jgi:hypothetical protein